MDKFKLLKLLAQAEIKKREKAKKQNWYAKLTNSLFHAQKEFALCKESAIAALCTRRAGKTHAAGAKLLFACRDKPHSTALYLALTRKSAKQLLWPKLKQLVQQYSIPATFNESDLICKVGDSQILLYGADQSNLAERLRGDAYSQVVIDEAGSFGDGLQYLIEDVLEPALLDFQGGIALIGTPAPILAGEFYKATSSDSTYKLFKWSLLDNPHLPHAKEWIDKLKSRRGWTDSNPTFLREYCGIWTEDPDSLVYKLTEQSIVNSLPDVTWNYIIGLDIGYEDPAAWSVIAFSSECDTAYLVHSESHQHKTPEFWAKKTLELVAKYRPLDVRVDAGALGKAIMIEMQTRWKVPCSAAEKNEKMAIIELMNGDLAAGKLKILSSNSKLIEQARILVKDSSGTKEDPTLPNDLLDSFLYSYRHSYHFLHKKQIEIKFGSKEYWEQEERKMLDSTFDSVTRQDSWLEQLEI